MSTDLLTQLAAFETDYWYEVDRNWGREAHAYYREDGVFVIGDKRMEGAKAVVPKPSRSFGRSAFAPAI